MDQSSGNYWFSTVYSVDLGTPPSKLKRSTIFRPSGVKAGWTIWKETTVYEKLVSEISIMSVKVKWQVKFQQPQEYPFKKKKPSKCKSSYKHKPKIGRDRHSFDRSICSSNLRAHNRIVIYTMHTFTLPASNSTTLYTNDKLTWWRVDVGKLKSLESTWVMVSWRNGVPESYYAVPLKPVTTWWIMAKSVEKIPSYHNATFTFSSFPNTSWKLHAAI